MAVKKDYPCPEVGVRVQIGTIDDMLNNIGAYDYIDKSMGAKIVLIADRIPAGFNRYMVFLEGAQGTVEKTETYDGNIRSKFLCDNYKESTIKRIYIRFDDPAINKYSTEYIITTPMLVKQKSRYDLYDDIKFKQNFASFSKCDESYNSVENIL